MTKIVLTVLIFLSAADIVMYDGKYSESAGRLASTMWHQTAGR